MTPLALALNLALVLAVASAVVLFLGSMYDSMTMAGLGWLIAWAGFAAFVTALVLLVVAAVQGAALAPALGL